MKPYYLIRQTPAHIFSPPVLSSPDVYPLKIARIREILPNKYVILVDVRKLCTND